MKKVSYLFLCFLMMFSIVGCSGSSDDEGNNDTTDEEQEQEEEKELTYGDVIKFDDLEIVFSDQITWTTVDNQFSDFNGSEVVVIPVSVTNKSDETHGLNMFYYTIYGSKGTKLDSVTSYFSENDIDFSAGSMRPDAAVDTYTHVLYDGDGDYYIEFDNYSEKIEVKLPISK